jgi:transglutaminase-like putative cysteine protease
VRYHICHKITYTYDRAVVLQPHILRLRPRSDGWQQLYNFSLAVQPEPVGISHFTDFDGNASIKLSFAGETENLQIVVTSEVETLQTNPFNFLLEPWATQFPIDYPSLTFAQLQPYLQPHGTAPDSAVVQLAQEIYREVEGKTDLFPTALNQRLYQTCKQIHRAEGNPWVAGVTWREKQGACRDVAVLLMEVCRIMGLGARFVSGYQEGDRDQDERELHAWAEVYLPGGGWRGFDPAHGLAVTDRHIALAASAFPSYAAPILGGFAPIRAGDRAVTSQLDTQISIQREE